MKLDAAGIARLKRLVGIILGIIVTALIALFFRPEGLSQQGCYVLAFLAGAIVWWVCDVLPEFATSLIMLLLFVTVAGVSPQTALSFFSNSIWWLLLGAFAIGLGMKETGLLKRMALDIVSIFPVSFTAQAAGFIACGTLLGPLIPSLAAKASLLSPLCMEVSDTLGYKRKGREANGLFLAMFTGLQNVTPALISGSIMGYTLLGLYPEEIRQQFDFVHWFIAALPWFVPITLVNFALIILLYRPRRNAERDNDSGTSTHAPSHDVIVRKRRELGKMSRHESYMAIITAATVALWITQGVHGIPAWMPAIGALVAMTACGIIDKSNFANGLNWGSLIFIGVVLGLGDVFSAVGLTTWIVESLSPVLTALAANPYLLVVGVALITIAARFLIVAQTAFLNIFMVFAMPVALALGINPWVIGMASFAVINVWFVKYQNPCYLAAYYSVDGKMVKQSEMARYCVIYTIASIACLMIAVPFWQGMGLL